MTTHLQQLYWNLLARWQRRRHPRSLVLSPEPAMQALFKLLAQAPRSPDKPLLILDGGAHDGRVARELADLLRPLGPIQLVAFEPNEALHPAIAQNLEGIPHERHVAALAAASGSLSFTINQSPMTSSVLAAGELSKRCFGSVMDPIETRTVAALALDDWFDQRPHAPAVVDLLKLDIQGYELEALRGAEHLLRRGVRCVYLEVHMNEGLYEGAAVFSQIDAHLRARGYALHNLYHLCTHLPQGRVGSADALYVFEPVTRASTRDFSAPEPRTSKEAA